MKFLFSFLLIILFSFNGYAQESSAPENPLNIMELVLFLNANRLIDGAASFEADPETKTLRYFDEDGRLMEESYIDENNDIVNKKYDKEGQMVSEIKITEESIMGGVNDAAVRHEQVAVPEAKAILQELSDAAESYARENQGNYPREITDLTEAEPPYLDQNYCNTHPNTSYIIYCTLGAEGYEFKALSYWSHRRSDTYIMKTGGILERRDK